MSRPIHLVFARPQGEQIRKGPYARVRFENEVLREAQGAPVIGGHLVDRSRSDWYCHDDGRHWPLMVVEPAE